MQTLRGLVEIKVPEDLWPRSSGWSGKVIGVRVSPGDRVREGDVVAEVEIEKAVLEIESPVSGVVVEVKVRVGDTVGPGDVLAVVKPEGSAGLAG